MPIYFLISLIGVIIGSYILYFNLKRNQTILYLGSYFFLLSLYSLSNFVIYRSQSVFWISVFYVHLGHFAYLIGPMSYFYIRSTINDDSRLKKTDAWHLSPFLFSVLISMPYSLNDWEFKTQIASSIAKDHLFLKDFQPSMLSSYVSNLTIYLSRPISIGIYALTNLVLIVKNKARKHKQGPGEKVIVRWLYTYNIFQISVVVCYGFALYLHFGIPTENVTVYMHYFERLTVVCMVLLMLSPSLFPRILYGLPVEHFSDEPLFENSKANTNTTMKSTVFDAEYLQTLQFKVEEAITEHQLYLQSKTNLNEIARFLTVPEYHLKFLFSTHLNISFKEYCDTYRVEHSKKLLRDVTYKNRTLEAIALSSGFANRNAFTKSFQKITGIKPSEY